MCGLNRACGCNQQQSAAGAIAPPDQNAAQLLARAAQLAIGSVQAFARQRGTAPVMALGPVLTFQRIANAQHIHIDRDGLWGPVTRALAALVVGRPEKSLPAVAPKFGRPILAVYFQRDVDGEVWPTLLVRPGTLTAARTSGDAIIDAGASNMNMAMGNEGQWFAAAGFDATTDVRFVWQQRGREMHAWARIVWPGRPPVFIHAMTDLAAIQRELEANPNIKRMIAASGADIAQAGWFGSKLFKKIGKAAKKVGLTKVMEQVRGTVAKAMNNPMVQQALMSTPYGAAALGIYNGAKIARAAMSGNLKAKNAIGFLTNQLAAGVPGADKALMFIRQGAQQVKQGQALASMLPGQGGGQPQGGMPDFSQLMSMFQQRQSASAGASLDPRELMQLGNLYKTGADNSDVTQEVDALMTFATAGAFDGMRWLVSRMGLHSMEGRPNELTKRQALLDGRNVLATRFA